MFFIVVFLSSSILFGSDLLHAQLKKLWDFPDHVNCVTFLEFPGKENTGFVGLNNGDIWKSTDYGITWQKTNTPPLISNHFTQISDFSFKDSLVGWSSHNNRGGSGFGDGGCYKTTNGGLTWFETHQFSSDCNGTAVYYNKLNGILFLSAWDGSAQVTSDEGLTWNLLIPNDNPLNANGLSFNDDIHGVMMAWHNNGQDWFTTSDGGVSWNIANITPPIECWQPLAVKGTSKVFGIQDNSGYYFVRSDDYGNTWRMTNPFIVGTGCTRIGNCNILYVQGETVNGESGTIASGDWGQTWMQITSEASYTVDTRFYVHGDSIYTGGENSSLWLYVRTPSLVFAPDSFDVKVQQACTPVDTILRISNLFCDGVDISSFSLEDSSIIRVDTTAPIHLNGIRDIFIPIHILSRQQGIVSTNLHIHYLHSAIEADAVLPITVETLHNVPQPYLMSNSPFSFPNTNLCNKNELPFFFTNTGCDSMRIDSISLLGSAGYSYYPKIDSAFTLSSGQNVSLKVRFDPAFVGLADGSLKVSFLLNGKQIDTIILFNGIGLRNDQTANFISGALIDSLHFDSVYTCQSKELTDFIVNRTCDSALIQVFVSPQNGYTLTSPINSVWLKSGDTLPVKISFTPKYKGVAVSYILINVKPQNGNAAMLELDVDGIATDLIPKLEITQTKILPDTTPFCQGGVNVISFSLTNKSLCDSIRLDSIRVNGAKDFVIPILQGNILPDSSLTFNVIFLPQGKGLRVANLDLHYFNGIKNIDTSILLSTFVTDGIRILHSSTTSIGFDTISVCDERDSFFTIQNLGCDTLHVSNIVWHGLGFGSNTKFPIAILPGEDTTIDVFTFLDTGGGKTKSLATLTLTSDADSVLSPILPIYLTRTYSAGSQRSLGLYLDPTLKSGGDLSSVSYNIKETPGKTFAGAGVKQIYFDLNYNPNLLTFDPSSSTTNLSGNGRTFTITGSPEIKADVNGVMASVGFRVYLTKDSITTIDLLNANIDTLYHSPCGNVALDYSGSATFDYSFVCGERSISGFMKGILPLKIISLHPNPAQDEIELNVESSSKQGASVDVYDALGTKVFSDVRNMLQGANTLRLETKNLSSGVYLVRLYSANGETSQSFVKVR